MIHVYNSMDPFCIMGLYGGLSTSSTWVADVFLAAFWSEKWHIQYTDEVVQDIANISSSRSSRCHPEEQPLTLYSSSRSSWTSESHRVNFHVSVGTLLVHAALLKTPPSVSGVSGQWANAYNSIAFLILHWPVGFV